MKRGSRGVAVDHLGDGGKMAGLASAEAAHCDVDAEADDDEADNQACD